MFFKFFKKYFKNILDVNLYIIKEKLENNFSHYTQLEILRKLNVNFTGNLFVSKFHRKNTE